MLDILKLASIFLTCSKNEEIPEMTHTEDFNPNLSGEKILKRWHRGTEEDEEDDIELMKNHGIIPTEKLGEGRYSIAYSATYKGKDVVVKLTQNERLM